MPPSSRSIPPLLHPFVRTPKDDSILLLTSTLGASANWLTTRFLCDALSSGSLPDGDRDADGHPKNVLLVSWMRDYEFWRQEVRKGGGLDLGALRAQGRFAFVDGLSALFLDGVGEARGDTGKTAPTTPPVNNNQATRTPQPLPVRGPPGRTTTPPARGPPSTPSQSAPSNASTPSATPGHSTLTASSLAHLKSTIIAALTPTPPTKTKTLLILDNPDLLLATAVPPLTPSTLTSLFLTLHTHPSISHLLIHLQSDTPLLAPSTPPQPLQIAQQNLVVKVAHMSRRVLGVRVLDTGVARDVSGVLRVTENRDTWVDLEVGRRGEEDRAEGSGAEVLYKVNGDRSVKVFERGAEGNA